MPDEPGPVRHRDRHHPRHRPRAVAIGVPPGRAGLAAVALTYGIGSLLGLAIAG